MPGAESGCVVDNVRVQTMAKFFLIAGVLFVFSSFCASARLEAYSVFLLPVPVAVCVARRRLGLALGLVVFSGLGAMSSDRGFQSGLMYALIAMAGMPIGLGVLHRWSYGKTLAAVAATASVAAVGGILANWQDWLALSRVGYDTFMAQYANQMPPQFAESMQWGQAHWADVGVGLQFALVLMGSVAAMWAALNVLRRRYGLSGLRGSFSRARVSEWLIWAAIAVAALWFADRNWPDLGLRAFTWNTAIGLAAVYWLNGLSVLLYGLDVLRPGLLGYLGVVLLVVSFGFHPVGLIGLFDTWVNFRRVIDRIVEERKRREEAEQAEQTDDK